MRVQSDLCGLCALCGGYRGHPERSWRRGGSINKLTELALAKLVITLLLAAAAFAGGLVAASRLNVELMPELNFPVVTTMVAYPGASPQDVADQVTKPVEQALGNLSGLKRLQSTSAEGFSIVVAEFEFGRDIKEAEATLQSALSRVSLPPNAQPPRTARINFNDLPVMQISLTGQVSPSELRRIASDQLVPELSRVEGVYSVELLGGEQQEVKVVLDPEKAAQKGVSFQQVASLLQANSLSLPGGSVEVGEQTVPVRTVHQFQTADQLRDMVVGVDMGSSAGVLAAGPPAMPPSLPGPPAAVAQGPGVPAGAPPVGTQPSPSGQGRSPAAPPANPQAAPALAPPLGQAPAAQPGDTVRDASPSSPSSPSPPSQAHTVRPGDTLWDLAERYGTTIEEIAAANHLANPDMIHPDETLVIPQRGASGSARPAGGLPSPLPDPLPAPTQDTPTVKLGDIASVSVGPAPVGGISRTNGKPSVLLRVSKTQDANAVQVARGVTQKLEELAAEVADVAEIQVVADESQYVERSIQGLGREGLLGMAFAVLVIFAFLQTLRGTLIAAVSIPFSIALAFLPMLWQGFTLNIMTMAGLAVAVGRVVDDSIVVLENAYRHVQAGQTPAAAARLATAEVAMPIAASTATTVAVFLPLGMVGGIVGQAFRPFAFTVSFALLASLLVALTLVPALCRLFIPPRRGGAGAGGHVGQGSPHPDPLPRGEGERGVARGEEERSVGAGVPAAPPGDRPLEALDLLEEPRRPVAGQGNSGSGNGNGHGHDNGHGGNRGLTSWLLRLYTPVLRFALRRPAPTLLLAVVLLAASLSLAPRIPTSFLPSEGEKLLMVQVTPPLGSSRDAVSRKAAEVEELLSRRPEVRLYHTSIGDETGTLGSLRAALSGRGAGGATLLVRLDEGADLQATSAELRKELEEIQGDGRISVSTQQSSGSSQLRLVVSSGDSSEVAPAAQKVERALQGVSGLANLSSDTAKASAQISIQVDPNKAAELGLTTAQVGSAIHGLVTGQVVGRLERQGDSALDIRLSVPPDSVDTPEKLGRLPFGSPRSSPLSDIAQVQQESRPAQITRVGQSPAAEVSGDIIATDAGSVSREVRERIAGLDLPEGVLVDYGGVMQQMTEGFSSMAVGQIVGVALVYLTMALFFNSLLDPLVILVSLPLAAVGVLPALYFSGRTLSMSGMIGMLMLIGIVVTNAIVLLDFARRAIRDGRDPGNALLEAGRVRLRPILMTALVTILALVPLALGLESGSIIASDLAIVVIGGLMSSTLLTLLVVPTVYRLVKR